MKHSSEGAKAPHLEGIHSLPEPIRKALLSSSEANIAKAINYVRKTSQLNGEKYPTDSRYYEALAPIIEEWIKKLPAEEAEEKLQVRHEVRDLFNLMGPQK